MRYSLQQQLILVKEVEQTYDIWRDDFRLAIHWLVRTNKLPFWDTFYIKFLYDWDHGHKKDSWASHTSSPWLHRFSRKKSWHVSSPKDLLELQKKRTWWSNTPYQTYAADPATIWSWMESTKQYLELYVEPAHPDSFFQNVVQYVARIFRVNHLEFGV